VGRQASGAIVLYRPAASNQDRNFELQPGPDGRQTLDVRGLAAGPWNVRVSWQVDGIEYRLNERIVIRSS
jgi:nitrogen fixation protein FixH